MKVRSQMTMKLQRRRSFMRLKMQKRRSCLLRTRLKKLWSTRLRTKSTQCFQASTRRVNQLNHIEEGGVLCARMACFNFNYTLEVDKAIRVVCSRCLKIMANLARCCDEKLVRSVVLMSVSISLSHIMATVTAG